MFDCVRKGSEGVYIDLNVSPNSKKEGFSYDEFGKRLRVPLSSPAVNGRANKELLRLFSGLLGNCELASGQTSRKKTLLVRNAGIEAVCGILAEKVKK